MLKVVLLAAALAPTYTPSPEAEQLNAEAAAMSTAENFHGAAQNWQTILDDLLKENVTNKEERDNVLHLALGAYLAPYDRGRGRYTTETLSQLKLDVRQLRKGVALFDGYVAEFRRVHGGAIGRSAQQLGERLRDALADAKLELEALEPEPEETRTDWHPPDDGGLKRDYAAFNRPNGIGLIVAGSLVLTAGLGMVPMIVVGAARDDRQGTAMVVTGAVVGSAALIAGATMLGIGIKRRLDYIAFAPQLGRGYAGLSMTARF